MLGFLTCLADPVAFANPASDAAASKANADKELLGRRRLAAAVLDVVGKEVRAARDREAVTAIDLTYNYLAFDKAKGRLERAVRGLDRALAGMAAAALAARTGAEELRKKVPKAAPTDVGEPPDPQSPAEASGQGAQGADGGGSGVAEPGAQLAERRVAVALWTAEALDAVAASDKGAEHHQVRQRKAARGTNVSQ